MPRDAPVTNTFFIYLFISGIRQPLHLFSSCFHRIVRMHALWARLRQAQRSIAV